MATKRAVVQDGHVSIEVDYPDGTELDVTLREAAADEVPFASLGPKQRAKLDASITRGLTQADADLGRPIDEFIDDL